MWSSIPGGGSFMTRFTPNGVTDYLNLMNGGDWLNNAPGLFCVNEPARQLPCFPGAGDNDAFAGSRSRHPGGIKPDVRRRLGPLHQEHDQPADLAGDQHDRRRRGRQRGRILT